MNRMFFLILSMALLIPGRLEAVDPPYVDQTQGTQQVLVVFLNFPDRTYAIPSSTSWTSVTDTLRTWMSTVSYGKAALQFTLVPTLGQMPNNYSTYTYDALHTAARNHAIAQGFNLSQYHRVWAALQPPGSTGLADCPGSRVWVDFASNSYARHEFAHTFGTLHPTGWDDALMYAPCRQRMGWLTEADTQGYKVLQRRNQSEVRGLYDLTDSESTAVVPNGVRGLRVHSDNIFTYGNSSGRTTGVFVAMLGEKLYHFAGDNMTSNTASRYFINPGESHLQNGTVFTSGTTKATAQVRIQYLRSGRTNTTSPFQGVVALSVVATGQTQPVASGDLASTTVGTPVDIPALANDSTGGDGSLSLARGDAASVRGGTISWSGGTARYTPPSGFTGIDSFSYIISNGGPYALGTVVVTVGSALTGDLVAWEDFESCGYAGGYGWTGPWTGGATPIGTVAGTDGAWAIQLAGGTAQTLSRVVDLSQTRAPRLSLRWRANNFILDLADKIVVDIADGGTWTTLLELGNTAATPNQVWYTANADLAAFAGRTNLSLRLRLVSPNANFRAAQVDSIAISDHDPGTGNAAPVIGGVASSPAALVLP